MSSVLLGLLVAASPPVVTVGSKTFTESVVLGELFTQLARQAGATAEHRRELGGTRVLFEALRRGDILAYPEYTGTLREELFAQRHLRDLEALRAALGELGLRMGQPLGFNNTYALGMKQQQAEALGVRTISQLAQHPQLRLGFSNEFMDRGDGWRALQRAYQLPHRDVRGMDHDLAYRGLKSEALDVMDLYATDAEIRHYQLAVLEDDRRHFPEYQAVILYRAELDELLPEVVKGWGGLSGRIDQMAMVEMNARAKLALVPEAQVAADFLFHRLGVKSRVQAPSMGQRLWQHTASHLGLVALSMLAAIALAVPLGIVAARFVRAGQLILGAVGLIQTIPSLALLVFMIPLLGIGAAPAIAALFLYSLLPIVRNTHAGLTGISPDLVESARALGLSAGARLRLIELPLASRSILAGVKTAVVINIGTATLGAVIGAGGYGQPILTGIRLDNLGLILEGAIPAALLALLAQGLFEVMDRLLVPKGLRLAQPSR